MERRISYMNIILLLIYVLLSSLGLVLFKLGAGNPSFAINIFNHEIGLSVKTIIGILFYGFSFLLWLYIVSKSNLTYIFPIQVALVNLFVVLESVILLNEKVGLVQGLGIIVITIGVIMMKWGSTS